MKTLQKNLISARTGSVYLNALAILFTGKYGQIEHTECIHKGYSSCKYTVTWKRTFSQYMENGN